jgi:hypothetical protein
MKEVEGQKKSMEKLRQQRKVAKIPSPSLASWEAKRKPRMHSQGKSDWNSSCRISPHLPQALNPLGT